MSFLNQPWGDRAQCWKVADPEAWWAVDVSPEVRQVCMTCPVRSECLQYALDHGEDFGIWGGLSEGERAELKAMGHTTVQFGEKGLIGG